MDKEAMKKTVEQAKTHTVVAPSAETNVSVERRCLPRSLTYSRKHLPALCTS